MTTPNNGQQDSAEPSQPGTREPGEDVPRQQAPAWEYRQQQEAAGQAPGQPGPYPQQEAYGQPGAYGQQGTYGQAPGQQGAYGQPPGQQDPYGQQPYGQAPGQRGVHEQQPGGYPPGTYGGYPPGGGAHPGYPGSTGQLPYLNGGKAGFGQAVGQGIANLFSFRGRASRSAFWWFVLFTVIVQIIINAIASAATHGNFSTGSLSFVSTLLTLAVSIRRLHDTNRSGWWWLIGLVPIVGWIVLLVFYLMRGTRGPNRFDVPA